MIGEIVKVITFEETGRDAFNAPVRSPVVEEVSNVLVAPGDATDHIESMRPDGTDVRYTLYVPKTFSGELEGANVEVRGEQLHVIGKPDHFDPVNCPTDWWMVAKVGVLHG